MKTIYKYPLTVGIGWLPMPKGAEIISCASQFDIPVLYALVDPDEQAFEDRRIAVMMTGESLSSPAPTTATFLGTCMLESGAFAVHVFELVES